MIKEKNIYWELFRSTFQLSAFTFGGGYVIIPLMRKKFVEDKHWMEEQEMMDLTAIAQSSPGAIAVNASILIGYRIAGIAGAIITILGTVLSPLIIISVISLFYAAFRDNLFVNLIMKGMQAGVAAVIFDVVISMGHGVLRLKKWIPILVMLGAFVAAYFYNTNVILIILVCGFIGGIHAYHEEKTRKECIDHDLS